VKNLAQSCDENMTQCFKNSVTKAAEENRVMFSSHDFLKHCVESSAKQNCLMKHA